MISSILGMSCEMKNPMQPVPYIGQIAIIRTTLILLQPWLEDNIIGSQKTFAQSVFFEVRSATRWRVAEKFLKLH